MNSIEMDWKSIVLDDPSWWPSDKLVSLDPSHDDDRGSIQSLVNLPTKNVSIIFTRTGSVRANHYHLTDWHYMYVISGRMEYYYCQAESDEKAKHLTVNAGQMVFTPPMEIHATVFPEDTTILAISRNARDQESYEADVRRVQLVDPNSVVI